MRILTFDNLITPNGRPVEIQVDDNFNVDNLAVIKAEAIKSFNTFLANFNSDEHK